MPTNPTSPDEALARRVCAMLGWELRYIHKRGLAIVTELATGVGRDFSWPDLSAACLRHVEAKGWWLWEAAKNVDGTTTATLSRDDFDEANERPRGKHDDLFRAICAACAQTEGAKA